MDGDHARIPISYLIPIYNSHASYLHITYMHDIGT